MRRLRNVNSGWPSACPRVLRGKAAQVAAEGFVGGATLRVLSDKQREPVDAAARYLLNHQHYMHYDRYLAAGLPIGAGGD